MRNMAGLIFIRSLLLSLLSGLYFSFPAPACATAYDETITAIDVAGLIRINEDELIDLMSLRIGEGLDRQKLARGIRRAFKKNIFNDIRVISEPSGGGIKLTYFVEEIPLVKKIVLKGNENMPGKLIRKTFYYQEGEDFKKELLQRSRLELIEFYKRKGYPDAAITITVKVDEENALVILYVNIDEGEPFIIKKINADPEVRFILSVTEGGLLDQDRLDRDMIKIEEHYKKKRYVNPVVGPYYFSQGELSVPVHPGPRVHVEFTNNREFSKRKLEKELVFMENEEVSDESVTETADRIRRLYVSRGYLNAQIAAGVERKDDLIKIAFLIFEGEKVILNKIDFTGVSIKTEALKRTLPFAENKPFNRNLLNDSRGLIVRFYNALGHLQADVKEIREDLQDNGREMHLEFIIDEGPRTTITSIEILGNEQIALSDVLDALHLDEGAPYNVIDIGDARRRVLSLYRRSGFLDADIDVKHDIDNNNASLIFRINEKRPSLVGKVILSGNRKTKAKIVNRELILAEGERYNYDHLTQVKQRLYQLGIFSEVSIDVLEPGIVKGDEVVKDVLITLKEGKSGSMEISLGYGDYEEARGSLGVSYNNLGGYNRQIGFRAEVSSVERRYIVNFREPWLFNWDYVPLKIFLIREEKRAINIETRSVLYKIDKQSFIAGIEKEIADGLKIGLDYEYSFTDTKDVEEDVILSREDTGTLVISSVSPSLFYDARDNPFDPSSGSLQRIVVKYASKALVSEAEFIKGSFLSSWYLKLMNPVVFAFSVRGGAAYGFGDNEEIPLIERFFLGGRATVRGYSNDALGPKGDDDNPTGGNVFALTNAELRFSLGKGFGLVTFIDAGNVWKTIDDVQDELKYTAGAGLRYNTPVGPIRVDYGHKMNKEEGDSSGEVHFSFGHAF